MTGRCLCGACSFTATPEALQGAICHCVQCQKWSGGIFMSVECGASTVFKEGAPVGTYASSEWAERLFCKDCGTTLVWQMKDGTHQGVAIAAFDDQDVFSVSREIFIDCKPAAYAMAGNLAQFTEAETMAQFAPEGGA